MDDSVIRSVEILSLDSFPLALCRSFELLDLILAKASIYPPFLRLQDLGIWLLALRLLRSLF